MLLSLIAGLAGCEAKTEDPAPTTPTPPPVPPPTSHRIKDGPHRLLVISSYHKEYLWSEDTNRGLVKALLEFGYFENQGQANRYSEANWTVQSKSLSTKRMVIHKLWMDTKRKTSLDEIARTTTRIVQFIQSFRPDLILLGDDNAANYLGNRFLDSSIPIVFWGINGLPLKYGLLDSIEKPGHNITGIYQKGYLRECLELLKQIVPSARSFAILADDSPTSRAKEKMLRHLDRNQALPLKWGGTIMTNHEATWKAQALETAKRVDAFFILNHNTIKNAQGEPVDQLKLGAWYLRNINLPECGHERQFVQEGMLAARDDSGFNQAYEAMQIAHAILKGANPATIPSRAPLPGNRMINTMRAKQLGIRLPKGLKLEILTTSRALAAYPR